MMRKILFLIVVFFLILPFVNAESGTITVPNTITAFWNETTLSGGGNPDFHWIVFDNGNYSRAGQLQIQSSGFTFSKVSNSATFTCISAGDTCSGSFAYFKNGATSAGTINYFFNDLSNLNLSSSYIHISITPDITGEISCTGGCAGNSFVGANYLINASHPWGVADLGTHTEPVIANNVLTNLTSTVSSSVSAKYVIVYPTNGLFNVSIDKSPQGNLKSLFRIHNSTNNDYFAEPLPFNHANFSWLGAQNSGIYLNMSLANGASADILVNSSGVSGLPTPTPTPPLVLPGSSSAISFDRTKYHVNDIGTLTTNYTFGFFDFLSTYRIDFYSNINPLISQFKLDQSLSSQSFQVSFPTTGTYTANIVKNTPFLGDSIQATATTTATDIISYLFVPSSVVTGSTIQITYQYGQNITKGAIDDNFGFYPTTVTSTICPCDTSQRNVSYTINGVGKHQIRLWDDDHIKIVATANIDVLDVGGIVPVNITSNYLALDNSQYSFNDVINAQYQISSFNWTNYSVFRATLSSSSNVTMGIITINAQTGTFQIPVNGGDFHVFQSGSAFVNVSAGTGFILTPVTLMSVPVTIIANNGGYSINVQPSTICLSQNAIAKYTSPNGAGILQVQYLSPAGTTKTLNYSFNQNGTQTFSFTDGSVHDNAGIVFSVYDTNNIYQVNTIVKYQSTGCTVPGTTPTPTPSPTPSEPIRTIFDGWVGLLGFGITPLSRFFFAWLITTIFIIGGFAMTQGKLFGGTLLGGGAWGWFMALGYLPTWFAIIVVLEIALMTRWFR